MEDKLKQEMNILYDLTMDLIEKIKELSKKEDKFYEKPQDWSVDEIQELEDKIILAYRKGETKFTHLLEMLESIEANKKF